MSYCTAFSEARSSAAYVTKPDNKIGRVLHNLLRQMPSAMEQVAISSLAASSSMSLPGGNTAEAAPSRLGERHKYIVELQVGGIRFLHGALPL